MGLFGGSSKSSTTTQNYTYQYDERIAATDSAMVAREGSSISILDGGAVQSSLEFGESVISSQEKVISSQEKIALAALESGNVLSVQALEAIGTNADKALEFVDKQRTDEQEQTMRELMPWIIVGVSVVAMTAFMGGRK